LPETRRNTTCLKYERGATIEGYTYKECKVSGRLACQKTEKEQHVWDKKDEK